MWSCSCREGIGPATAGRAAAAWPRPGAGRTPSRPPAALPAHTRRRHPGAAAPQPRGGTRSHTPQQRGPRFSCGAGPAAAGAGDRAHSGNRPTGNHRPGCGRPDSSRTTSCRPFKKQQPSRQAEPAANPGCSPGEAVGAGHADHRQPPRSPGRPASRRGAAPTAGSPGPRWRRTQRQRGASAGGHAAGVARRRRRVVVARAPEARGSERWLSCGRGPRSQRTAGPGPPPGRRSRASRS